MNTNLEPLQPVKKYSQHKEYENANVPVDLNSIPALVPNGVKANAPKKHSYPDQDLLSELSQFENDKQIMADPAVSPESSRDEIKSSSGAQPSLINPKLVSEEEIEQENQVRSSNVFESIAQYCDVSSLLSLALVSHAARSAATKNEIWEPICAKLGIRKNSDPHESQADTVSPLNVLDIGFVQAADSSYQTFIRAYRELFQFLSLEDGALKTMPLTDQVLILGNSLRLSQALGHQPTSTFMGQISKLKEDILEELTEIPMPNRNTQREVFRAAEVFSEKFEDGDIQRGFAKHLFQTNEPKYAITDFLTIKSDDIEDRQQISQLKIEKHFQSVAASLLALKATIFDSESPVPALWKNSVWSSVLAESLASIVVFIQEILETAANDISELEYLIAVPKIYVASQIISGNSILRESRDLADFDFVTNLHLSIMNPVLEEFCERQANYVDLYAREMVKDWDDSVSQRENETEQFLWSSVPKKADKTNFISSLRWAFLSADASQDAEITSPTNSLPDGSRKLDAPATELEAQTAVLVSKLRGMESLVSLELAIDVLDCCRAAMHRLKTVGKANANTYEPLFCSYLKIVGKSHIKVSFDKAMKVLNEYDPKRYGRVLIPVKKYSADEDERENLDADTGPIAVEPLAVFTELMSIGDIVQQMVHLFFEEELVATHIVKRGDIVAPSVNAKRKFEQMLDDILAEGLSRGIDVLMEQVDFTLLTEQLGSDYFPLPNETFRDGPTPAASKVIELVRSHLDLLRESTEKNLFDVFQQEVGVRLFTSLTKHLKRQIITTDGATYLIADINAYYAFIVTLRQKNLLPYYQTLKQISQLFLIDTKYAKQIGHAISDSGRYNGLMTTEDLVELVKRRQDWPIIKPKVEKVLYGIFECIIS